MTTKEPRRAQDDSRSPEEWTALLHEALKERLSARKFDLWGRSTVVESVTSAQIVLSFDNSFQLDWNQTKNEQVFAEATANVFGPDRAIEYTVRAAPPRVRSDEPGHRQTAEAQPPSQPVDAPEAPREPGDFKLNKHYTLDNFVVGPSNQLAYAAARAVADTPGGSYNPLFIHGPTGLGKTHLLQGICHQALQGSATRKVRFLSSETFVNEFIAAIERGDLDRFRYRYRSVDLLLIDDIHLLAHKERTQEEFFHTFNTLYNEGKQIVLSSDSSPSDIPTIRERLSSRFSWGLVTEIKPPRYETRLAILQRKAHDRGLAIGDDVLAFLAQRIERNIRELEGAINKVAGYAQLSNQEVDLELAQRALQHTGHQSSIGRSPEFRVILEKACGQFGVTASEVLGRRRTQSVVQPRQVCMWLARKLTNMSYEEIGRHCGGRDHSTVLYAVRKVEGRSKTDPGFAQLLAELEREILS